MIEMRKQISCQKEEQEERAAADEAGFPAVCRSFDLFARKITQENKSAAPECSRDST